MNARLALVLALLAPVAAAAPSTAVRTATVKLHSLAETVTAYGRLTPAPGALEWLTAAHAGRVAAVLVTPGNRVARGQRLLELEPTPQSRAAYQGAAAAVSAARAKLAQTRSLARGGLATQADLAAAQGSVATAEARLAALRGTPGGAGRDTVQAGAAGVVAQVPVTRGEWVQAGARLVAVAPPGALWVRLGLAPQAAAGVRPGAAVRLVPVFGGAALRARVARVDARASASTGLVDAEVPVAASAGGPLAGEWVTGTVTLATRRLPAVPRSAVLKDARGYYVFVVRAGHAHRRAVQPLVRAHGLVGLRGVQPGEVVVTQGNFELSDGDAVRRATGGDTGS